MEGSSCCLRVFAPSRSLLSELSVSRGGTSHSFFIRVHSWLKYEPQIEKGLPESQSRQALPIPHRSSSHVEDETRPGVVAFVALGDRVGGIDIDAELIRPGGQA